MATKKGTKVVDKDVKSKAKDNREDVELIAISRGFDGVRLVEPGQKVTLSCPLDENGNPKLPKWAVPPEQYEPTEEEEQIDAAVKPGVRGGASGAPQL